jgi:hypothetical protein
MTRLAVIENTLVSAWLGAAILVAAVVAPAAFRVLPSRTLAGAVVGQILPVIFAAGLLIAVIVLGVEARLSRMTLPARAWAPFATMIIGCVLAQFVIGPKIEAVRAAIGGAVELLDASDPRRVEFGRLHGFSVLLMGVAMAGAGWALLTRILQTKS